ncbi:hypothetical protein [Granulicoccus phenolivorans]|uniref:hypothetical protein n=1 Tax=Granulicoccus phenolivorans TaxID=266854 RepID=UPI000418E4AE|nr:hypothetical protein [Granulicoccus phenolivorans]
MLAALRDFAGYLGELARDTVQIWWALFPQLMTLHLVGWLGYHLTFAVAVTVADTQLWPAVALFSTAFVWILASILLQLRLLGDALGVPGLVQSAGADPSDEPNDLGRLLAVTLLPFLGIYAAFGYVDKAVNTFSVTSIGQTGVLFEGNIFVGLVPAGWAGSLLVFGIIVVTYCVRRGLDLLHEKFERRFLGILAALVECFFLLTVVLTGSRTIGRIQQWWATRRFSEWIDSFVDGIGVTLAHLHIDLGWLLRGWDFIWSQILPLLAKAVVEPVVWLAVAALVFGTHVLSVADLWRRGERPSDALSQLTARRLRRAGGRSVHGRRAWLEFQEAFLGDVDDKYVPTFQALRLVLHVGLLFLAAFIVLHAVITSGQILLNRGVMVAMGGHSYSFWSTFRPLLDLIGTLLEPLRLALLAVTFHRCLLLLRARTQARRMAVVG